MLFGCLLFVTNACQKDELKYDTPTEKKSVFYSKTAAETSLDFFDPYFAASQNSNVTPSTASDDQMVSNPLLQEITQELSIENNANEFVTKTTKMIGYPIWNKSSLYESFANAPNVSIVMTPFAFLYEDKTNSILMTLKVGNDFHFNVISREYADFITNPETISQFSLDADFVADMEVKKGMYCSYDGKVFDAVETLDDPFTDVQIDNLELEDLGGTPQYTMTIIIWIVDPYGSCDMFGGGGGGTLTGHAINIHTSPTVGGPGGSTGNPTGSGGSGGGFNPNEDGDGFDEDFEDEAEFDPNFNDALNGFEDRVINKILAVLGVFNGEFTGEEQQIILGFVEYLDSTNPAFIPNPEEAFHEYLLATNAEYAEFNEAFANVPPWMWPLLRDLAIDVLLEIFRTQMGSYTITDDIIDAWRDINQGDWWGFLNEAFDIAAGINPQLKTLKASVKTFSLSWKAAKLWGKFQNMAHKVGQDTFLKIYNALSKNLNILNGVDWKGNKNIKIAGIDPMDLWQSLKDEFGIGIDFPDGQGQGGIYFQVGDIFITYYPNSNSTNSPTIAISKCKTSGCTGPPTQSNSTDLYKFRF